MIIKNLAFNFIFYLTNYLDLKHLKQLSALNRRTAVAGLCSCHLGLLQSINNSDCNQSVFFSKKIESFLR